MRICDPADLDKVSDQVAKAIEDATNFVTKVTSVYNDNKGYAPGLSGLEKSMTEIKPFFAGSDVTIFEFLDKFNTYCTGCKKVKAYKLYNNYISPSIQAQTASFSRISMRWLTTSS